MVTTNDIAVCTSFLQHRVEHILGIGDQAERERESGREKERGVGGAREANRIVEQTTCDNKNA